MIIEYSVKNYRSIKELQTLSLVAAPIKSKYPELDTNNLIHVSDKLSLLKTVGIYGANGSGKSNIIKSLISMLLFVRDSFKNDDLGVMLIDPFLLNKTNKEEPSFFQLTFICDTVKYRYGFELFKNEVLSEWLFGTPEKNEVYYFTREGADINVNKKHFSEGLGLAEKTSKNNLFLNITKAFNGKLSKEIYDFFIHKISLNAGVNDIGFRDRTLELLKYSDYKQKIINLLNEADFGINDINHHRIKKEDLPDNAPQDLLKDAAEGKIDILVSHRSLRENNHDLDVTFSFDDKESEGTKKLFNYSGIVIDALQKGRSLFIDEFDSRLHPLLTKRLVEMFNSSELNKEGAQLVFVTHDTNLLDNTLMRRDQIYFVEKKKNFETELYSLVDFKGVRNDASFEKDYIKGKYGAIPFLGNFENILN